ncbi:hypothetical protein DFQ30_002802, partial [Apophysomyces sp. BC1015]
MYPGLATNAVWRCAATNRAIIGPNHCFQECSLKGLPFVFETWQRDTPVYLRNKELSDASCLLAYLPVIESSDWGAASLFRLAKQAIFHHCISLILEPFRKYPNDSQTTLKSFELRGPYNNVYECIPVLACYTADLPE